MPLMHLDFMATKILKFILVYVYFGPTETVTVLKVFKFFNLNLFSKKMCGVVDMQMSLENTSVGILQKL
ncbi:hypothetical protein BpHYR1_027275 [Brachionus plicatilis]|uniref:Uncharacterized protein n=1 Tax=Brachionus plicatilis TaxID=10195 RepID=A0A3M7RB03_BRAPC|nr:hypothetical protein BpHYR1_027275 [Brachionus plicatilis]